MYSDDLKRKTANDRKKEMIEHRSKISDVREVLSTEAGQRVLFGYLKLTGFFWSSFSESHASASFREGERSIGRAIFQDLGEASPEFLASAMREHVQQCKPKLEEA